MPTIVITGANRNVGRALAKTLAAQQDNTVITLSRSVLPDDVASLNNVKEIRMDISDLVSIRNAAQRVSEISNGKIDTLILNAASGQVDHFPIGEDREDELGNVLQSAFLTNTVGPIQLVSLLIPMLRAGDGKKIFAMTSGHAVQDVVRTYKMQGRLPYGCSKTAMDMAMIRFGNELSGEGFTVVCIAPSVVMDEETAERRGAHPQAMHADEAAQILLGTMKNMGPGDSGRIVGMWGSEDRFI